MNDIYNLSHKADITAKQALDNINRQEKAAAQKRRANDLLGCLIRMCSLAGYDVFSEIVICDRKTGEVYSSKRK